MIEVLSPGDETHAKLDFYATHSVNELIIADPDTRRLDWYALNTDTYEPTEQSRVLDLQARTVAAAINWPP